MLTFWTIFLILSTVSVHELGHAWAMREKGIGIKRIALIGIPWPNITWRLPIKSSRFPGTEWVIHPMVLGAYVEPKEDEFEAATPKDSIYIYSMGPIASVLIGIIFMGFARVGTLIDQSGLTAQANLQIVTWFGSAVLIWVFREQIAKWLSAVLGVALFFLVIIAMYVLGLFESLAGPVGVVNLVSEHASNASNASQSMAVHGIDYFSTWQVFYMAGLISIMLGLSNLIPFLPLDGGHILRQYMPHGWREWYMRISFALFISLVVLALASDLMRIF